LERMDSPLIDYEDEVITMLRSLWSPARVVRYLRFRYGDATLTVADVQKVKDQMAPGAFIRPSKLAERGDVKVDTLLAMSRLLLAQEERVSAATLASEQNPGEDAAYRVASKLTKQYWDMLVEFSEVAQSVGELPKVGTKRGEAPDQSPMVQQTVVLLGDLKPKELSAPAQALISPREDAYAAGIVEGDYEEVDNSAAGASRGSSLQKVS